MKARFLQLVIQQAHQSAMPNKLGAILVHQKHVIGAGYNRVDHPWLYKVDGKHVVRLHPKHGMHAEVACLYGIGTNYSSDATMYVVRLRKDGTIGLSKPCASCHMFIKTMGIKRVIYSDNDGSFKQMRIR